MADDSADQPPTDEFAVPPLLDAVEIGVRAPWGRIYGPTSVIVPAGGVTVLQGSEGRGRTALLLTLAGRMKPSSGTLTAFGHDNDARRIFKRAAIAYINEIDSIAQGIRVRDVLTEQLRWGSPWCKFVPRATDDDLERLCRPVFGDLRLPSLNAVVEELPELTSALLRIAMADVRRPELLVVGGVDKLARDESSDKLMERLIELGREQTVITSDVNGAPSFRDRVNVVSVENLTDDEFVRLDHIEGSC
ncbi:MAG: ATP-binding cassette domain-containing protein [Gordonia sp. (in: high G+C Gram-positive bacteria)]